MKKIIVTLIILILTSCNNQSNKQSDQNTNSQEQLLARITELEKENKELKDENMKLKNVNSQGVEETSDENISQTNENTNLIGGQSKGNGEITLSTPGGEGDDVILIVDENAFMASISINYKNVDVDGNEPTIIYVDGKQFTKLQLSKKVQGTYILTLEKDNITKGKHNIEVIQEINGEQTFYKLLSYTVK